LFCLRCVYYYETVKLIILVLMSFSMIFTEKGTSLGDKTSAMITDNSAVCLFYNQSNVQDLRQALPFARNVDNS